MSTLSPRSRSHTNEFLPESLGTLDASPIITPPQDLALLVLRNRVPNAANFLPAVEG